MGIDVERVNSSKGFRNGGVVVIHQSPATGVSTLDTDNLRTTPIYADVSGKYDDSFNNIRHYTGDTDD